MMKLMKLVVFLLWIMAPLFGDETTDSTVENRSESVATREIVLTWAVGPRGSEGRVAQHKIEFLLDGKSYGYGFIALASIYEILRRDDITKLTVICSRSESPNFDPIRSLEVIKKIYPLLREKNIELALRFDQLENNVLGAPLENPFSPSVQK